MLLICISFLASGCGKIPYLIQAGKGQLEIINHARPISEVVKDEKTPPRIRTLLGSIESVKKYGEKNGLKPTSNYSDYVKLNRRAAVWVVSACEPLQFKAKEWSFPIVGSFPYLGWFDLEDGKHFTEELKKDGWDVDLRGAGAYSTLGWFRDSVLSTMISDGLEALGDLVNVILHESVHATLYIKGQSYFNESIASFVADHLTLTYLDEIKGPDSQEKNAYLEAGKTSAKIQKSFHSAYLELSTLYSSPGKADSEKKTEKQKILQKLMTDLHFKREINNATLIQYKTYHSGKGNFEKLLETCQKDWPKFLKTLATLRPDSFAKAQEDDLTEILDSLVRKNCPQSRN